MNCPIINLRNKQTVLRRNFFQWKASKNSPCSQKQENRQVARKTKYDIIFFFEFPELGEEKSQTYLVYSRINCSAVSTSVLFEEKKTEDEHKFITAQFIQKIKLACISTTQQSQQSQQTQVLFAGANIGVINVQLVVLPCSRESKRSTNNSFKRRQHFLESSDEEDLWTISLKHEANFCHSLSFWWFWHIFDSFMSTFCRLFSMNCNIRLTLKKKY